MQVDLMAEPRNAETLYSLILEYINLPCLSKKESELIEAILQIILYESDLECLNEIADVMGEILCDEKEELDSKSKLLDLISSTLIEKVGIPFVFMLETESFKKFFHSCEEDDNLLYFGSQKLIQAAFQRYFLRFNGADLSKILPYLSSLGEAELRDPDPTDIFENMYCNICFLILNPNSLLPQNLQETLRNAELAISQRVQARYKREFLLDLLKRFKTILSQQTIKANSASSSLTIENVRHGHNFTVGEALPQVSIDLDYMQVEPNQYKLTPDQLYQLGVILCEMLNLKAGGTVVLGVTDNAITGLELTQKQREMLSENIEEVISRLRPSSASKRIGLEYIQLKNPENTTEKLPERFVLRISVERSLQHDFENNPFRLMGDSEKNWNMSEIHFRQQANEPEPQLNFKEIARYAAAEEFYRGVESLQENTNAAQMSPKQGIANKEPKKGHLCQIFVRTAFKIESPNQVKLLWKYPGDDDEEEIELVLCKEGGKERQTKMPIRVRKGELVFLISS